jgi:hypothetical protein
VWFTKNSILFAIVERVIRVRSWDKRTLHTTAQPSLSIVGTQGVGGKVEVFESFGRQKETVCNPDFDPLKNDHQDYLPFAIYSAGRRLGT